MILKFNKIKQIEFNLKKRTANKLFLILIHFNLKANFIYIVIFRFLTIVRGEIKIIVKHLFYIVE